MPDIGNATLVVTPVLAGAQQKLTSDLTNAAGPAGLSAGTAVGNNMAKSIGGGSF